MSEAASSSLVCAGPLVSVAMTGTNCSPCVDSILAKRRLTSCRAQAGQLTSGLDAQFPGSNFVDPESIPRGSIDLSLRNPRQSPALLGPNGAWQHAPFRIFDCKLLKFRKRRTSHTGKIFSPSSSISRTCGSS
jgi:hypothetical protein